mgnify:CR=1 FL=1
MIRRKRGRKERNPFLSTSVGHQSVKGTLETIPVNFKAAGSKLAPSNGSTLNCIVSSIENCSVYVLPSYREGTPRTVLEAMAMGRPIITTDAPGCRPGTSPASGTVRMHLECSSTALVKGA